MKGKGDIHELIRIEAFLLSEKAGHPSHMSDYFWAQAEAIVRQRAAIVDVAVKAAKKRPAKSAPAKSAARTKQPAQPELQPAAEMKRDAPKAKKPVAAKKTATAARKIGPKSK